MVGSDAPRSLPVGRLGDFALDRCTIVEVDGRELGIVRTRDAVYAILNRCPHRHGGICHGTVTGIIDASAPDELTYDDEHRAVRCPWHGWEFLLDTGEAVGGITRRRLQRYPVELRDGEVFVLLRPRMASAAGDAA